MSRGIVRPGVEVAGINVTHLSAAPSSRYSTSLVEQRQNEEAAALQDVLNEMANNVFDLNLLAALAQAQPEIGGYQGHSNIPPSVAEPSYVQERAQEYGRRLQPAGHTIAMKVATSGTSVVSASPHSIGSGLVDLGSHGEVEKAIFSEPISETDAMLIAEVSARAQEAFTEFRIEHCENLVVQFGQQPLTQYSHAVASGHSTVGAGPGVYAMGQQTPTPGIA